MKKCIKCNIVKSLDCFHKNMAMKDGHINRCKECTSEYNKLYSKKNNKYERLDGLALCPICNTLKPTDEYYRNRFKKNGIEYMCKICSKEIRRSYRISNNINLYEKRKHKKTISKKFKEKENLLNAIHKKVQRAVRSGRLIKMPCEICGNINSLAHHNDYSKPLEVIWLCHQHHKDMHQLKLRRVKYG